MRDSRFRRTAGRSRRRPLAIFTIATLMGTVLPTILLAATPASAVAPVQVGFTLEGCNEPAIPSSYNPDTGDLVCNDADYTTGNLGKNWEELDLVPHRITLKNNDGTADLLLQGRGRLPERRRHGDRLRRHQRPHAQRGLVVGELSHHAERPDRARARLRGRRGDDDHAGAHDHAAGGHDLRVRLLPAARRRGEQVQRFVAAVLRGGPGRRREARAAARQGGRAAGAPQGHDRDAGRRLRLERHEGRHAGAGELREHL